MKPSLLRICGSTKVVHLLFSCGAPERFGAACRSHAAGAAAGLCLWVLASARSGDDAVPVAALVVLAAVLVALARLRATVNQAIAIDSRAACACIEWGSDRKLSEVYEYQAQAALDFIAQGNDSRLPPALAVLLVAL